MKRNQTIEEAMLFIDKANNSACDEWQIWRFIPNVNMLFLCGYKEPFQVICFLIFCDVKYVKLPQKLSDPTFSLNVDEISIEIYNKNSDFTTFVNEKDCKGEIKARAIFFTDRKK